MTLFATLQPPHQAAQRPLLTLQGAIAGTQSYLLARLAAEQHTSLFIVTPDARQRDLLAHDLRTNAWIAGGVHAAVGIAGPQVLTGAI